MLRIYINWPKWDLLRALLSEMAEARDAHRKGDADENVLAMAGDWAGACMDLGKDTVDDLRREGVFAYHERPRLNPWLTITDLGLALLEQLQERVAEDPEERRRQRASKIADSLGAPPLVRHPRPPESPVSIPETEAGARSPAGEDLIDLTAEIELARPTILLKMLVASGASSKDTRVSSDTLAQQLGLSDGGSIRGDLKRLREARLITANRGRGGG